LLAINAAACLHVMGACDDWADGTNKAREAIRSGAALATLEKLLTFQSADPKASQAQLHALL
jgi:anthranilate phosphoribosyltransferase